MHHRHSRAHVRYHRERVVRKRWAKARRIIEGGSLLGHWEQWFAERPLGELENEQAWLGCRRSRCGLCHPHKRWPNAERQHAEAEWRRDWGV